MSRFFRGGDDSSSESSSDEEELLSEEEEEAEEQTKKQVQKDSDDDSDDMDSDEDSDEDSDDSEEGVKKGGANWFLKDASSESEDSDEEVRAKVKSAKDKRLDELEASIKQIENGQKNGDWTLISNGRSPPEPSEAWLKYERARRTHRTNMDRFSPEFDKLARQVARLQEGGKTPKPYIRIVAELEDFMNEALAKQKVTAKKMNATQARALNAVKQKIKKNSKDYQTQIDAYRANKDEFMESSEEDEPAPKPKKVVKILEEAEATGEIDDEGFVTMGKGGRTLTYTPESIFKHLRGINETRGKKNTDRLEQIGVMEKLNEIATTPYQQIRVLLSIVSSRFDLGSGTSNVMPLEHWKAAEKELSTLLTVLDNNRDYVVVENVEEWEDDEKPPTLQPDEKHIKVAGSLVSYVERLDDELARSLQSIDPHTSEYIERLQDEGALYNIIFRGLIYYEYLRTEQGLEIPQDSINRIIMRRLEHVYFKVSNSTAYRTALEPNILTHNLARPSHQSVRGQLVEGRR